MALTIELPTHIEAHVRQSAALNGISIDNYVANLLRKATRVRAKRTNKTQLSETELLKKVNLAISISEWENYRRLVQLRKAECLTPQDHQELIALSDKIEVANAERMKYVLELSKLRAVALPVLMRDLKIVPVAL